MSTPIALFFKAIESKDLVTIKALLPHINVNSVDSIKRSVLYRVLVSRSIEMLKLVLEQKPKLNEKTSTCGCGSCGLEYPIFSASWEQMQLLVKAGIDVNVNTTGGETVLQKDNTIDHLQFLLDNGANINYQSSKDQTSALFTTNLEKIKFLIKNNIDISLKNSNGLTALEYLKKDDRYSRNADAIAFLTEHTEKLAKQTSVTTLPNEITLNGVVYVRK